MFRYEFTRSRDIFPDYPTFFIEKILKNIPNSGMFPDEAFCGVAAADKWNDDNPSSLVVEGRRLSVGRLFN